VPPPADPISFIPKLLWPNDNGDCLADAMTPCYSKWLEVYTDPVDSITDEQLAAALPPHLDPKANPFGNSKSRTAKQKAAAKREAERLLALCPPDTVVCFCDGSASPNPGPSGTGVVVYLPAQRDSPADSRLPSFTIKIPHGYDTNNTGELWGPMIAMLISCSLPDFGLAHYTGKVYIFSDSKITIDMCMFNYYPTVNKIIYLALRDIFINTANSSHLAWVAGHASIDENELADKAAKSAMAASALRRGKSIIPDHLSLLPLLIHHSLITPHRSYRSLVRNAGFVPRTNPTSPFLLPAPPATRSPSPLSPALSPTTPPRSPSPPPTPPEPELNYDQQRNANYATLLLEHPGVPWESLWDRATPVLTRRRR
jgi:ribonuclease HI